MTKIKLSEWAERNSLSYITANRQFHAGLIPGASQLDSGTILVEDDTMEQTTNATTTNTNEAMSLFLKKTVEFSKNNSTVEDFAAFVISNFRLSLNIAPTGPKYSKNKPKSEEVQKHFQQFIPDKEKSEQLKAIKDCLKEQVKERETNLPIDPAVLEETFSEEPTPFNRIVETNGMDREWEAMGAELLDMAPQTLAVHLYGPQTSTEGLVTRSVDCNNATPQPINYTGSTNQSFGGTSSFVAVNSTTSNTSNAVMLNAASIVPAAPFQPTQKERQSAVKVIETADTTPRKRGRKPTLKR